MTFRTLSLIAILLVAAGCAEHGSDRISTESGHDRISLTVTTGGVHTSVDVYYPRTVSPREAMTTANALLEAELQLHPLLAEKTGLEYWLERDSAPVHTEEEIRRDLCQTPAKGGTDVLCGRFMGIELERPDAPAFEAPEVIDWPEEPPVEAPPEDQPPRPDAADSAANQAADTVAIIDCDTVDKCEEDHDAQDPCADIACPEDETCIPVNGQYECIPEGNGRTEIEPQDPDGRDPMNG